MNWQNLIYPIRRKYQQIKRVIDFLPIIWNGFDFDYTYSIQLFKKQLERQAKYFESGKSYSDRADQNVSRIRTAIRLMDKVYDEEYGMEWVDKLEEQFGKETLEWEFEDTGDGTGSSFITSKYEKWDNAEEIRKVKLELISKSDAKQKKASRILITNTNTLQVRGWETYWVVEIYLYMQETAQVWDIHMKSKSFWNGFPTLTSNIKFSLREIMTSDSNN